VIMSFITDRMMIAPIDRGTQFCIDRGP